MKKYFVLAFIGLFLFGCIELGDGWVKVSTPTKYVCPDDSVVTSPDDCPKVNESSPELNLTKPDCESNVVLTALTNNLLTQSNSCRQTRISVLCGTCSSCCSSPGVAKTEYEQSIDASCYSCAATNFGVTRARDYYDMMGAFEHMCVENCPELVSAYQAFLQYGADNTCELPAGWKICNDVT